MTIKRFRLGWLDDESAKLYEHPEGEFVTFKDYEAATALEAQAKRVEELEGIIEFQARCHSKLTFDLQDNRECSCSVPVNHCAKCGDCDYGENDDATGVRDNCDYRQSWVDSRMFARLASDQEARE